MGAIENFLLPVIGGYLLLTHATLTKHATARLDSYNLIFRSLVFGLLLWVAIYSIMWVITCLAAGTALPEIINGIESELPAFIGLSQLLCVPVGFGFPHLLNVFLNDDDVRHRTALKFGDDVEVIVEEAFYNFSLIEVTLKSRKVYVGTPAISNLFSRKESGVVLIPYASGHRREDNLELLFTTWYDPDVTHASSEDDVYRLRVGFSFDQIVSVRPFEPEMYMRFLNCRADGQQ